MYCFPPIIHPQRATLFNVTHQNLWASVSVGEIVDAWVRVDEKLSIYFLFPLVSFNLHNYTLTANLLNLRVTLTCSSIKDNHKHSQLIECLHTIGIKNMPALLIASLSAVREKESLRSSSVKLRTSRSCNQSYNLTAATIPMGDEWKLLDQWIAYHSFIGIQFFLYTTQLLAEILNYFKY